MRKRSSQHDKQIALIKFLSATAKKLGVAEHTYVVGGAIRDFVMGKPIKDSDIVIDPTETGKDSAWFADQLQRFIPVDTTLVTNNYGVAILTVKGEWLLDGNDLSGEVIEIANTRKESYGGEGGKGYKPSEVQSADIVEDVLRRELSINTLLMRLSEAANGPDKAAILDLTGCGLKDIEDGVLRCPSDPDKTFSDDPTRMIRLIKFMLRYGFKPTKDVAEAVKRNARKIRNVPYEAVAKLLVADVFKEKTYAKGLALMDDYGLLDHLKAMMLSSKDFQTYIQRWSLTKPVAMMLDLMDLGLPLQANTSFLSETQQQRLREVVFIMPDDEATALLQGLKQPSSVWKDKDFFDSLVRDSGIDPKKGIPEFSKRLNYEAREVLLDDPTLINSPDSYRRAVTLRMKEPGARLASTKAEDVNLTAIILDDPDKLLAWYRKTVVPTLPMAISHHVTLAYEPDPTIVAKTMFGKKTQVKVVGVVNMPDIQIVEVRVDSSLPTSNTAKNSKFHHVTVATEHGVRPAIANLYRDRVTALNGPTLTGVVAYSPNGKQWFTNRPQFSKQGSLLPLMNPEFNLREIVKQMILLEDHLFHARKQCPDCIDKHLLTIEAFAEEMVSLSDSPDSPWIKVGEDIAEFVRHLYRLIDFTANGIQVAANEIRKLRKALSKSTREHRTELAPVNDSTGKTATKSQGEKEDEAASDLVRPSPKNKPPRKDLRNNQVKDTDPDLAKKDPDLSLNYKRV
jgi:tRNA nucleotidyltransferase/poly(A) polymerase